MYLVKTNLLLLIWLYSKFWRFFYYKYIRAVLWEAMCKVVYTKYWLEEGSLEPKLVANYVLMTRYVLCLTE